METKEFNELVKRQSDAEIATLSAKADESARGDRLGNFKSMVTMLHCTPEKALIGLVAKHWIALLDFIADIDKGVIQSAARWDEKIGDIRAYMTLLKGLVTERLNKKPVYEMHVDPAETAEESSESVKHYVWYRSDGVNPVIRTSPQTFKHMFLQWRDYAVKTYKRIIFYSEESAGIDRLVPKISCVIEPTGRYTLNPDCPAWVRRVAEKAEKIGIDVKA